MPSQSFPSPASIFMSKEFDDVLTCVSKTSEIGKKMRTLCKELLKMMKDIKDPSISNDLPKLIPLSIQMMKKSIALTKLTVHPHYHQAIFNECRPLFIVFQKKMISEQEKALKHMIDLMETVNKNINKSKNVKK